MIRLRMLAPILLSAAATAPAASPALGQTAAEPRQCFSSSQIGGFQEAGDQAVNIRVGVRDVYRLELTAPCHDVRFAQTVGVQTRGGTDFICSGLDAVLIVPRPGTSPDRCFVSQARKLSPAEVEALPARERP